MQQSFDAILTGSDSPIEGVVTPVGFEDFPQAYNFVSIDNTLHLTITKDDPGHWIRVAGTEPFFAGWVDELAEQIESARMVQE